jgi:Domain of unknown function (DUF5615)
MTAVRLYFDEDSMQHALVEALRLRDLDVLTALEADMIEREDEEHLRHAASLGRALCSFNVGDFCRLHGEFLSTANSHQGIILARQQQYSVGEQMRRIVKLVATLTAEDMQDRLEFLSAWD